MVTTVRSLGLQGISGYEVTVECFLSGGLPAFDVVGLGDTAVKEARERVRAAIKNCGAKFPVSRITVNLAPANLKKEGTVYDLPLLLGILAGEGEIDAPDPASAFIGELSLTGALRPISGVLPMAMAAARAGVKALYVPAANAAEATLADGLTVRAEAGRIEKPTFGSTALGELVRSRFAAGEIDRVELVGLCTDICVISNALLCKAFCPELPVSVDAACCAGVTPENHRNALSAMQCCQIDVLNIAPDAK